MLDWKVRVGFGWVSSGGLGFLFLSFCFYLFITVKRKQSEEIFILFCLLLSLVPILNVFIIYFDDNKYFKYN